MPVPISIFVPFVGGLLLAAHARTYVWPALAHWRTFRARILLGLGLLCCLPLNVGLLLRYPDWSLLYLIHPQHQDVRVVALGVAALSVVAPFLGFWSGLVLAHRIRTVVGACIVGVLVCIGWSLPRLQSFAYYDNYHQGGPKISITATPVIWLVLAWWLLTLLGLTWTAGLLKRLARSLGA